LNKTRKAEGGEGKRGERKGEKRGGEGPGREGEGEEGRGEGPGREGEGEEGRGGGGEINTFRFVRLNRRRAGWNNTLRPAV
jgi:hypothetical protein